MGDAGWEIYSPYEQEIDDVEFTPVDPDENTPESESSDGDSEKPSGQGPAGPLSKECPFCGKDLDGEQTYCYYCGAVF